MGCEERTQHTPECIHCIPLHYFLPISIAKPIATAIRISMPMPIWISILILILGTGKKISSSCNSLMDMRAEQSREKGWNEMKFVERGNWNHGRSSGYGSGSGSDCSCGCGSVASCSIVDLTHIQQTWIHNPQQSYSLQFGVCNTLGSWMFGCLNVVVNKQIVWAN